MDEETMKKYIEQGVTSLSAMLMLEDAKGMKKFRCSNCDKLLGMIEGKAEIKCPKCKTMNKLGMFNKEEATEQILSASKFITLGEFDEAYKKILPKLKEDWDKLMNEEHPFAKLFEPSNKTMLTFETNKADAFAGDIEIKVLDPITIKTIDHEHVTRLTRKEIEDKYGK